jgi:hypothetical protein
MNNMGIIFNNESWALKAIVLFIGTSLLFIWTLPGTIALRHILLAFGFILSLIYIWPLRSCISQQSSWPIWLLTSFFIWLIFHLIFFSTEFKLQRSELLSVWLRSLLSVPIGLAIGLILNEHQGNRESISRFSYVIFFGLSGTSVISFIYYILNINLNGQLGDFNLLMKLYKAKPPFVISIALFCPLCYLLVIRSLNSYPFFWVALTSMMGIFLSLFSIYLSNSKNGVIIFILIFIFFIFKIVPVILSNIFFRKSYFFMLAAFITLCFFAIKIHIQHNNAWPSLLSDIKVGIDIDHQNFDVLTDHDDLVSLPAQYQHGRSFVPCVNDITLTSNLR